MLRTPDDFRSTAGGESNTVFTVERVEAARARLRAALADASGEAAPADAEEPSAPGRPPLARAVPGSIEAAATILAATLALTAAGLYGGWGIVVCAAGLLWGKPWWRGLTLVLAILVGLSPGAAAIRLPDAVGAPLLFGSVSAYLGVVLFVAGDGPGPQTRRAALLFAVAGVAAVLFSAALLRLAA